MATGLCLKWTIAGGLMAKLAFVTGATGCVGRRLVKELQIQGWSVVVLVRPHSAEGLSVSSFPGVETVVGDLRSVTAEMVPREAHIFHLAALVHTVPHSSSEESEIFETNRDGTARLAHIARERNARSFVFLSTISVYGGSLRRQVCSEDAPIMPESAYSRSKYEAEQAIHRELGNELPCVILRAPVIYGPGDRGNFNQLIKSVANGIVPVIDGGRARKSTLYVGNLARLMCYLSEKPKEFAGQVFNVTDPGVASFREIVSTIAGVCGRRVSIVSVPSWLVWPLARIGDLLGAAFGKELPISSRRLDVMKSDSVVSTGKLEDAIQDRCQLILFHDCLAEFRLDPDFPVA
jgi:UDP-glucose 4-epimerase